MPQNPIQTIFNTLSIINSPKIQEFLLLPKLILMPIGLFFLFFIIFAIFTTSWIRYLLITDLKEFLSYRAFGVPRMTRRWERILARLETGNEGEYKLAVMEADTMLDEALKKLGFSGETIEERLSNVKPVVLPNIKDLVYAHTIRNNIVRDPNFILTLDQAKKTLNIYEQAFKSLDLI